MDFSICSLVSCLPLSQSCSLKGEDAKQLLRSRPCLPHRRVSLAHSTWNCWSFLGDGYSCPRCHPFERNYQLFAGNTCCGSGHFGSLHGTKGLRSIGFFAAHGNLKELAVETLGQVCEATGRSTVTQNLADEGCLDNSGFPMWVLCVIRGLVIRSIHFLNFFCQRAWKELDRPSRSAELRPRVAGRVAACNNEARVQAGTSRDGASWTPHGCLASGLLVDSIVKLNFFCSTCTKTHATLDIFQDTASTSSDGMESSVRLSSSKTDLQGKNGLQEHSDTDKACVFLPCLPTATPPKLGFVCAWWTKKQLQVHAAGRNVRQFEQVVRPKAPVAASEPRGAAAIPD